MAKASRNNERLDELIDKFEKFCEQYESDMRGDKKLNNGDLGVINEIRQIKELLRKYPSLTWLLVHRTLPTLAVIVGVYVFLSAIYTVGLLRLLGAMVGVEMP